MKELVVVSGKGGTGKTSLVGSFAALAENAVLADCDVDAADLHLLLEPRVLRCSPFSGGSRAAIAVERCSGCGRCAQLCRFDAVVSECAIHGTRFHVDPIACEGCGVCAWFCPAEAIDFSPANNGQWYVSETRCGPMVHAKLGVAEENSGKLVSLVRAEARKLASRRDLSLTIVDGSPGIGCPVIASITGAQMVLIVTEPTLSGLHDLERVVKLTRHFRVATLVCVNKWDLNPEMTEQIEATADEVGATVVGRVRYDRAVTQSQIRRQVLVEYADSEAAFDVKEIWRRVSDELCRVETLPLLSR